MSKHTTITITLDIDPQDLASIVDNDPEICILQVLSSVTDDDLATAGDGISGAFTFANTGVNWTLRGDS